MYSAYLSMGVILQAPTFKTVFRSALCYLRTEGSGAAVICREDGSQVCALFRGFHRDFIFRKGNENQKALLRAVFLLTEDGRLCWDAARLD